MPKKADVITKKYVSRNDIFADIVNYYVFNGEQKVRAEDLTSMDPVETALIKNRLGRISGKERIRDILKSVVIKETGNAIYVLVGVENQTYVHYAMPVRNLLYDALNYAAQVSENKGNPAASSGEFLSGFGKTDKIIPVITITFYWGDKPWDAPRKLSDMFKLDDLDYNKYVNDYNLNLIIPSDIKDTEKFRTELGLVIKALAARNDDEAFEKLITKEEYSAVDIMTADVICELTTLKHQKQQTGGKIDMCKAVEEIKRKAMDRGIKKGIDKVVVSMLANNVLPEEIAKMTDIPLEKILEIEEREKILV